MKTIGVDIGNFSVKFVELESFGRSHQLTHYTEIPLNQDITRDRSIDVLDALKTFAERHQDEDNVQYVVSLHEDEVTHRLLHFPFKERHKILKILPFELEEDVPFDSYSSIFDAKIVSYSPNGAQVLATASPEERIEKILQSCSDAGFEPTIVSTDGMAYANLFENWEDLPPEKTSLFDFDELDDDEDDENVDPVARAPKVDDQLIDIRSFPWGGRDLSMRISEVYQVTFLEALKELRKNSYLLLDNEGATGAQVQFSDNLKKEFDDFIHDLRLILLELQGEWNIELQSLGLSGGLSQIKNIAPYFTQKLELKCNRIQLQPHGISLTDQGFDIVNGGLALGLAIEGLKKPRNPATNLRQGEFAKQNRAAKEFVEKWGYSLKMAGLILAILLVHSFLRDSVSYSLDDDIYGKMRDTAGDVASLKGRQATESGIRRYIRNQKALLKKAEAEKGIDRVVSAMSIMEKLSETLPAPARGPRAASTAVNLDIRELDIQNETVSLRGTVDNSRQLQIIQESLKKLASNGQVKDLNLGRNRNVPVKDENGRTVMKPSFAFQIQVNRRIE